MRGGRRRLGHACVHLRVYCRGGPRHRVEGEVDVRVDATLGAGRRAKPLPPGIDPPAQGLYCRLPSLADELMARHKGLLVK